MARTLAHPPPAVHRCGHARAESQSKVHTTPTTRQRWGAGSCTRILRIIPEASIRGTIPPFQHEMRGRCYDSTPVFLPACADRLGVGIPDALRAVAMRARCSATATTQASNATPQALMRPPTLYRPDP